MATKVATTVTLKHLAANIAEENELSKRQAEVILGGLVGNIVQHLKKGERIRIGGLGILQVRKRAARMGRNPATGEAIQIKASKKVAFRASTELRAAIGALPGEEGTNPPRPRPRAAFSEQPGDDATPPPKPKPRVRL
jgi:DNA-binding protein HU-beta